MLKSILASLTGFGSDKTVMETAFAVARIDAGHIEALHTRIDATEVAALAGMTKSHVYGTMQEIAQNIAREESERSRAAQRCYSDACSRNADVGNGGKLVASSYREVTTLANETLYQARLHDLTVAARTPELARERLDGLVVSAGKPVLIAPAKTPGTIGETVVIAWKDSPEAARAITAALPILVHAKRVTVVAVSESRIEQDAEQASAEGLLALLKRHGVSAQLRITAATSTSAAEKIKEIAYEVEADLIVMGAYGHSRTRELIMGGATRSLLADCDIAVLMVH